MRQERGTRFAWALVSILTLGMGNAPAEEKGAARFDVDGVAGAETLTKPQRDAVAGNGFVVLPQDYKQLFQIYNELKPPFFITADSVIHAFSVILEDCIRKQESSFYDDLYECLVRLHESVQAIRQRLDAGPATGGDDARRCEEAWVFLAGFCGTAGRLLDHAFPVDARVSDVVSREVGLIEGATEGVESPLTRRFRDYSSFAAKRRDGVREFGQRYYRCVEFLKATGFLVESEREILAVTLLALYGDSVAVQGSLRAARAPRINDGDLSVGEFRDWERVTKSVRLLGAVYLPDAELLFRSAEPHLEGRELPSALDVGVLLGDDRARQLSGGAGPPCGERRGQRRKRVAVLL